MVVLILAFLAAPGRCSAAAELRVGLGMATRHPGVWRWRVETCCRAQEINATSCHTGCRHSRGDGLFLPLQQRSVGFLSGGDGPARLIAKGGVELPGWMAGGQAIVQWLGLRSQGHLFGAGLSEGARAKGQGKALRCLGQQGGQQLQRGQAGLRNVLQPAPKGGADAKVEG